MKNRNDPMKNIINPSVVRNNAFGKNNFRPYIQPDAHSQNLRELTPQQTIDLENDKKLLAPHPRSGRRNPAYFVLKMLLSGAMKYERYNPRRKTISDNLHKYGFRQKSGNPYCVKQITRLTNKLVKLVDKTGRVGPLKVYRPTLGGKIFYWAVIMGNKGDTFIKPYESRPLDEFDEKMSLNFEENVPTYIDSFYNDHINSHLGVIQEHDLQRDSRREHVFRGAFKIGNKKSGILRSEKDGRVRNLEPELRHRVELFQSGEQRTSVELFIKRLIAPTWQKNNLLEEIHANIQSMSAKGARVNNIAGFMLTKFKKQYVVMRD